MKTKVILTICMVFCAFQLTAFAQKAAPVTVTNTTTNPVPVTGRVEIVNDQFMNPVPVAVVGNSEIRSLQAGTWRVTVDGTARVQVDPNQKLQFANKSVMNAQAFQFPFNYETADFLTEEFNKVRVCANNTGNLDLIDVDVDTYV